jgi:hypothetical protein
MKAYGQMKSSLEIPSKNSFKHDRNGAGILNELTLITNLGELTVGKTHMGDYIYRHLFSVGKKCRLFFLSMHVMYILTTVLKEKLTHSGRVKQICVFNTVKLGTSATYP